MQIWLRADQLQIFLRFWYISDLPTLTHLAFTHPKYVCPATLLRIANSFSLFVLTKEGGLENFRLIYIISLFPTHYLNTLYLLGLSG